MTDILDDHPLLAYVLLLAATIVLLGGAIVAIVNPSKFPPDDYFRDVTIIAASLGLGTGISRFIRQLSATGSVSASASGSVGPSNPPQPTAGNEGG